MKERRVRRSYNFALAGVRLPARTRFRAREFGLTCVLTATSGNCLHLALDVHDSTTQSAASRALRFASELYLRFLLLYGKEILEVTPLFTARGQPPASPKAARGKSKATEADLDSLAKDVALRLAAGEPVFTADLWRAREMYVIALQTSDKVVRFLILYSALALAALFKWHDGKQQNVDKLLLAKIPTLQTFQSPRCGRRQPVTESIYTKLRNNFIHAEERSRDVSAAVVEIEANLHTFQGACADVLQNM